MRALGQKSVCCRLTPTSHCRQTEAGHGCVTHALLLLPVAPSGSQCSWAAGMGNIACVPQAPGGFRHSFRSKPSLKKE